MLSVAGSVALNRGKLLKREFRAFRYSSLTVPVAHKSFSIAAARPNCYENIFRGRQVKFIRQASKKLLQKLMINSGMQKKKEIIQKYIQSCSRHAEMIDNAYPILSMLLCMYVHVEG